MYHLIFVVKIKNNMRVCIIGSGLSALTLAKALVNENISVDMFPVSKNYIINKSRTLGISKSNLEYINRNIINIEKITWKLKKIEIFTDNLKNEKILNFENNNDQLFSIIKNFQFYNLLNKSLLKNKFFKKKKYKKKSQDFKEYDIVFNTDHSSYITKKYFNKKIIKTYNSSAYTTIIKHKKILNDVATQIFTKKGPLAFLPISPTETSIVYSIHNLKKIQKEDIKNLIQKYNFKYKIINIQKADYFELKSLSLRSYYNGKFLSFGDLLHKIHPLAGQGFNMIIRDIITLIEIIKSKNKLGLPLDSSVNIEFQRKLKHKNFIFSNGIDFVHELFNFERKVNNKILSKTIQFVGKNSLINKMFINIADKGI